MRTGFQSVRFIYLLAIAPFLYLGIPACSRPAPPASATTPGPPPLIEATLAGDLDSVRSHLQTGIDPNLVYHTNTALTYAARDGFTEIAQALIDAGADVNWIDSEGVTPLILAAFKGHSELAQLLLEHGADPTVKDQWDRTALDYALRRGEADPIVHLLQISR
ncbi:MAG: ankyrin repeat domain-containing protein [Cyanobacteria bacterium P01_D01_bin.44]